MSERARGGGLPRKLNARQLRRAVSTSSVWRPLELVESGPGGDVFRNAIYEVQRFALDPARAQARRAEDMDEPVWLVVSRRDGGAVRDWRHLQQIKNEVVRPGARGVRDFSGRVEAR